MIEGYISPQLEPIIPLSIRGSLPPFRDIEAVVDTGFNDYLTLPIELISELQLQEIGETDVLLADGSTASTKLFMVCVLWQGEERFIPIQVGVGSPLIGMLLLYDTQVTINVRFGDIVQVSVLP
jgi:clan AA aspartic protease